MSQVQFSWERRPSQPTAEALRRIIAEAIRRQLDEQCEVHVLITSDERIRGLNRHYLNRDEATDVLAFPDGDVLPSGRRLLGQIVISLDSARQEAKRRGHSELRELEELALHGTLHLLGHDHSRDRGEMDALEVEMRAELLP